MVDSWITMAALRHVVRAAFHVPWPELPGDRTLLRELSRERIADIAVANLRRDGNVGDPDALGIREMFLAALSYPESDALRMHAWAHVIGQQKGRAAAAERDLETARALLDRCLLATEQNGGILPPRLKEEIRTALGIAHAAPVV